MADRTVELQAGLFAALGSDADLTALIGAGRIHDHVKPGAPLPYVVIGDGTAVDAGGIEVDAQEHTLTIHCWSETPSTLQVKRMVAAVRAALHDRPPVLEAGRCTNLRCEYHETIRDPDGITHHGVMRFRAATQD
jgi:hypothetical protein